jgi:pimeloyl-ACP methyl ester carboxylesterase
MVTTGYLEHDVNVGGLRLHYQEWGSPSAPAIVMLHGFGVSGHMFDEFADRMQDHYHLIAIDQRGHGDSEWADNGDYSRTAFVNDLDGFTKSLGIDRFILIGHSMGGLNSVAYTVDHPERVRALVLVDVGPESAKEGVDNIVRFTQGPDELEFEEFVQMAHHFNQRRSMENIRERMRHRLRPTENGKYTWKFDRRFRDKESGLRIGSELSNDESWQLFRRVSVPTLLVRGADSDVLSEEVAQRAAREMPRARLVVVPSAGHSVPGDNPDDFTAAVRDFLGDLQQGQFEPVAASEPPPLQQLLQEHEAASRRGPGLGALVLAGIGAVLALAGVGYVWRRRKSEQKRKSVRGRAQTVAQRIPAQVSAVDLDAARQRASSLASGFSDASRGSLALAKRNIQDIDLDRARQAANDLVSVLGESAKAAPDTVRNAAARVDRKKLRKRTSRASSLGKAAGGLLVTTVLRRSGKKAKTAKPSRRKKVTAWRP